MTHHVDHVVATRDRIAFMQPCTYPDGVRVFSASMLELARGKITRQVTVQAWDS